MAIIIKREKGTGVPKRGERVKVIKDGKQVARGTVGTGSGGGASLRFGPVAVKTREQVKREVIPVAKERASLRQEIKKVEQQLRQAPPRQKKEELKVKKKAIDKELTKPILRTGAAARIRRTIDRNIEQEKKLTKEIKSIKRLESAAAKRAQRSEDIFRAVPGLRGDNFAQQTARKILAVPTKVTVGTLEAAVISGFKAANLLRALRIKTTSKMAKAEAGRAAIKTPVAIARGFDPRTPDGLANIASIFIYAPLLKNPKIPSTKAVKTSLGKAAKVAARKSKSAAKKLKKVAKDTVTINRIRKQSSKMVKKVKQIKDKKPRFLRIEKKGRQTFVRVGGKKTFIKAKIKAPPKREPMFKIDIKKPPKPIKQPKKSFIKIEIKRIGEPRAKEPAFRFNVKVKKNLTKKQQLNQAIRQVNRLLRTKRLRKPKTLRDKELAQNLRDLKQRFIRLKKVGKKKFIEIKKPAKPTKKIPAKLTKGQSRRIRKAKKRLVKKLIERELKRSIIEFRKFGPKASPKIRKAFRKNTLKQLKEIEEGLDLKKNMQRIKQQIRNKAAKKRGDFFKGKRIRPASEEGELGTFSAKKAAKTLTKDQSKLTKVQIRKTEQDVNTLFRQITQKTIKDPKKAQARVNKATKKLQQQQRETPTKNGQILIQKVKQVKNNINKVSKSKSKSSLNNNLLQAEKNIKQGKALTLKMAKRAKNITSLNNVRIGATAFSSLAVLLKAEANQARQKIPGKPSKAIPVSDTKKKPKQTPREKPVQKKDEDVKPIQIPGTRLDNKPTAVQIAAITAVLGTLAAAQAFRIRGRRVEKKQTRLRGGVAKARKFIFNKLQKKRRAFTPDIYSLVFGIRAKPGERIQLLRKGRVFTGLERRAIVK